MWKENSKHYKMQQRRNNMYVDISLNIPLVIVFKNGNREAMNHYEYNDKTKGRLQQNSF